MQLRWSHTVIKTRDMAKMVSFYEDVLGFEVSDRGPLMGDSGPEIVFMSQIGDDHHQVAFSELRTDEGPSNSVDHIAFRVASITDVREMMERVEKDDRVAAGAPITHGNALSVYFKDPEENGIEVFCDTPWHVRQPVVAGWDPSLSDEEVLAAVEAQFRDAPEFQPMENYLAAQARRFSER